MTEKSEAWHKGYNYYWHGLAHCYYERGTIEHAEWWEGWEAAVAEDSPVTERGALAPAPPAEAGGEE